MASHHLGRLIRSVHPALISEYELASPRNAVYEEVISQMIDDELNVLYSDAYDHAAYAAEFHEAIIAEEIAQIAEDSITS